MFLTQYAIISACFCGLHADSKKMKDIEITYQFVHNTQSGLIMGIIGVLIQDSQLTEGLHSNEFLCNIDIACLNFLLLSFCVLALDKLLISCLMTINRCPV